MADTRIQKKMKQGRHAGAQKRARQAVKRHARNQHNISMMKTAMKKVRTAVAAKDRQNAQTALKSAVSIIAKTALKGSVHSRTASRYISRLTTAVNGL
jgi:small subunit ribosomal protein S20